MNINTFLEQFSGDWFSQRTNYNLVQNNVDNSKANVTIKLLPANDPQVVQLSEKYNLNQDLSLGALASNWDNSPDWGKPKQQGSSLMLLFTDPDDSNTGKVVRVVGSDKVVTGRYEVAKDESITLTLDDQDQSMKERITFSSDNLRIRNCVSKKGEQVTQTTFYSEIRRVVPKEDQDS